MKLPRLQTKLQAMTPKQPRPELKKNWGSGRGGRPWRRLKQKIHTRDEWTCQCCGRVTMDLELDHIKNVAQGGTDDEANLQSLCVPCHKEKTQKESRL
ncbi:HNH endonuclease [Acinetobacter sp. YH12251]|uniref:HNH endonuclease n=1 Tax=Acinetobacter sp. YH12251 TaxID=2601176 RepID=UPI0015D1A118|nr:HNH endonuclease [Acinetobacter sp. YH12251]